MSSETDQITAEQRFRQAFERLRANKPKILKPGAPISQNNVAKEAGCDPSALRKTRFPSLIREIQAYVEIHHQARPSKRQERLKQRSARVDFNRRIEEIAAQRDHAQSQLASAQRRVVDLAAELARVKIRLDELSPPPRPLHG